MFKNLAKGSKVVILDLIEGANITEGVANITEGVVDDVTQPHMKDAQPGQLLQTIAFGQQQQDMVVDLKVSTAAGQRTFRNIPATAVVDRGGSTVITESAELMDTEIANLARISGEHIAKTPWHETALKDYDRIRKQLSPKYAHEQERDETIENLKNQYGELKEQNNEIQKTQKQILDALTKLKSPTKE